MNLLLEEKKEKKKIIRLKSFEVWVVLLRKVISSREGERSRKFSRGLF